MRVDVLQLDVRGVTYELENPLLRDGLKATVTVLNDAGETVHSDRLNLDTAKQRAAFAESAGIDPADLLTVRSELAAYLAPPAVEDADGMHEPTDEALHAALMMLDAPDLLDQRAAVVTQLGYAGDTRLVKLIDLVLISRLLTRPLNLVVKGPSSAGKSFAVNLVVMLHPPAATYHLVGMSERALVYTDADLQHRHLILGELRALENTDSFTATVLRALTWEGRVIYETVQKTADGLKPLRIEKPGPTGFISTTTGGIEPELETRVLTVFVPDTPETTRLILRATAGRANGDAPEPPDLDPLHAAGWWLETEGSRAVTIPFAGRLADLVPDHLVRMRRDFTQILTLVEAHAVLYQRQREQDNAGRIIADQRDYAAVYELVADVFGAIAAEGVTPVLRETVEALQRLTPNPTDAVSYRRLSSELGIEVSACRNRVANAIKHGWIVNLEDKKGRPARIRPGDALPAPRTALPNPVLLFSSDSVTGTSVSATTSQETCQNAGCDSFVTGDNSEHEPVTLSRTCHDAEMTAFEASTSQNKPTCHAVTPGTQKQNHERISADVARWLSDGTLQHSTEDAVTADGRWLEASKLHERVPFWLQETEYGGVVEREAWLWLEAVHAAVTRSLEAREAA